ncbi:hypothetical protein SERLADRAFT_459785 [Serpula lacrymans var. lacrymans S7.9]|uniref:Uncharacterized protein n=2 Tax=Serpula lacrymans var. lacrymans TaxID=341189 RepID=F8NL93_SERL9|nr:uncharacterized protein SERLADRAFT_459785 [Serpula lacrymans var. lacrymans S7.9]EGO28909.1 hypothetical protein SERLADRAFT_459785 [Serpula lacrymans var. lacrymans S7.9]
MNLTTSRVMEHYDGLRGFHKYLRRFLAANCDVANAEDPITIINYQCIYIKYQSMEDWNEGCDILRCNPSFNQEPRFDFVLVNTDTPEPTPARLKKLIRIFTQHSSFDIAVVKMLKLSAGNPRTRWTGARLYDEARDFELVKAEYLVRGVHMINAFDLKEGSFYLNDLIDGDMFLRFGN